MAQLGRSAMSAIRSLSGAKRTLNQPLPGNSVDAYQVWQEEGIEALRKCAKKYPAKYIIAMAHLIPQHFTFEHEHKLSGLTEAELAARLLEAQEEIRKAGLTIDLS